MKQIPLNKGQVAFVDDDDYDKVIKYTWYAQWNPESKTFYARTNINKVKIFMHRLILDLGNGLIDKRLVNHKNHIGTDNTRNNMEITNKIGNGENMRNQSIYGPGIRLKKRYITTPYELNVMINKKMHYIGMFATPEQAMIERCKFIKENERANNGK